MNNSAEVQPIDKVKRKRQWYILSVLLAVLLVAVIIATVVLVLHYKDDEDDAEAGIRVDGQWAFWTEWTECSATCGAGSRSRMRTCTDPGPSNGGESCAGESQDVETCADWRCYDCSDECPGEWDSTCSLCRCPGSVIEGSLTMDDSPIPVTCAKVFVETRRTEALTFTDQTGYFRIDDVCDKPYVFLFEGYHFLNPRNLTSLTYNSVNAEEAESYFTRQPQNTITKEESSAIFTCSAYGLREGHVVPPKSYEWFHNGIRISESRNGELELINVQRSNEGRYYCQAEFNSSVPNTVSIEAELTVDPGGECPSMPNMISRTLPYSCEVNGNNIFSMGICTGSACSKSNKCCNSKSSQQINVTCEQDILYPQSTAQECGCSACVSGQDVNVEGTVYILDNEIFVPTNGKITYAVQSDVQDTQSNGHYAFAAVPIASSVVMQFTYGLQIDNYLPVLESIQLISGVRSYEHLVALPANPTSDSSVTYDSDYIRVSVHSEIEIYVHLDGLIVQNGTVADDPRVISWLTNYEKNAFIPSNAMYIGDNGRDQPLKVYTVIGAVAESREERAFISGEVGLSVDWSQFDVETRADGSWDADVWRLDSVTARYTKDRPLSRQSLCGGSDFPPDVTTTVLLPFDLPYVAIARPLTNTEQCEIAVWVYYADQVPQAVPVIQVETFDTKSNILQSSTKLPTTAEGQVCLLVPCGSKHTISLLSQYTVSANSRDQNLPGDFPFKVQHNKILTESPCPLCITDIEGPIHHKIYQSCHTSTRDDYHFTFTISNVPTPFTLNPVQPTPDLPLSWYVREDSGYPVCFVRIGFQGHDMFHILVIATSLNENQETFGNSVAGAQSRDPFFSCLEVRCPLSGYTHVDIQVAKQGNNFALGESSENSKLWSPSSAGQIRFDIYPSACPPEEDLADSPCLSVVNGTGLYTQHSERPHDAALSAHSLCRNGRNGDLVLLQENPDP